MALKDDVAKFLRTNPCINRINFSLGGLKVYPSAYQKDVADAVASGEILVRTKGPSGPGAGASYDRNYDSFELVPGFSISDPRHQAFLVHESTHAHFDIQTLGSHSGWDEEAASYLAEAIFQECAGTPPLGAEPIRLASRVVAKSVLAGTYWVPAVDAKDLAAKVAMEPLYKSAAIYVSNGFKRDVIHRMLR